jgi:hypothetical protein
MAVTQSRVHPPARTHLERKQAEGKSRRGAIRCLKRQLVRVVFQLLKHEPPLTESNTGACKKSIILWSRVVGLS